MDGRKSALAKGGRKVEPSTCDVTEAGILSLPNGKHEAGVLSSSNGLHVDRGSNKACVTAEVALPALTVLADDAKAAATVLTVPADVLAAFTTDELVLDALTSAATASVVPTVDATA